MDLWPKIDIVTSCPEKESIVISFKSYETALTLMAKTGLHFYQIVDQLIEKLLLLNGKVDRIFLQCSSKNICIEIIHDNVYYIAFDRSKIYKVDLSDL